jgi:hypothetical protein
LTRLGGDRVDILFEDLRKRISRISGLVEELHFYGLAQGWAPRYRVGERVLFRVEILPGFLGATIEMEGRLYEKLLNSAKMASKIKMWLRTVSIREGIALLRLRLSSRSDNCSLANLLVVLNREQEFRPWQEMDHGH